MTEKFIRYCPLCGSQLERKTVFGEPHPVCPACQYIHFNDPKVAVGVLVVEDEKVLLVQRIYEPYKDHWGIPAGFMNAHEDPARAAERECLEETGLVVEAGELLKVFTGREHDVGADITLVYQAVLKGGTLEAGDDAGKAAFFSQEDLPPLAFKTTHEILGVGFEGGISMGISHLH